MNTTVVWQKCKARFDLAFTEVLNAHNRTWKCAGTA